MIMLVTALLLSPVLAEDTPLRVVSDGTGEVPVLWYLDGREVARTTDGQAAIVNATAGEHELWATTAADGPWTALARGAPPGPDVAYVPAWTASSPGEPAERTARDVPDWLLPVALSVLAAGVILFPKDP